MVTKSFVLVGEPTSSSKNIEIDLQNSFEALQHAVAQEFSIAQPSGENLKSVSDKLINIL